MQNFLSQRSALKTLLLLQMWDLYSLFFFILISVSVSCCEQIPTQSHMCARLTTQRVPPALWNASQEAQWLRQCHVDHFLISPFDESLFEKPPPPPLHSPTTISERTNVKTDWSECRHSTGYHSCQGDITFAELFFHPLLNWITLQLCDQHHLHTNAYLHYAGLNNHNISWY